MRRLFISIIILSAVATLQADTKKKGSVHINGLSDSFQKQYGIAGDDIYSNPDNPDKVLTVGYLKDIVDRLENEIRKLKKEIVDQKSEIQNIQFELATTHPGR